MLAHEGAAAHSDDDRVKRARAALPVLQDTAYLNTGYAGPVPLPVAEAVRAASEREIHRGRGVPGEVDVHRERAARVRALLAALVGAMPDEIALTRSTTDGVNTALWGIDWRPGDRVVTTSLEHEGVLVPLWMVEQRGNVEVQHVDVGVGRPNETLDALEKALRLPTRAIVVSHVAYSTGAVLPVREIVEMAHRHGALAIVDGAQSVGALPVDVKEIEADLFAFSGHKWLCGPEGLAGLYVARPHWETLRPTYSGISSLQPVGPDPAPLVLGSGARRYELASYYRPAVAGFEAGLAWLESFGWDWIHGQIREVSRRAAQILSQVPGCDALVDPDEQHGLVSFRISGVHPHVVAERLLTRGFAVRSVRSPLALRVSTGFFNTEEELLNLHDALVEVLRRR